MRTLWFKGCYVQPILCGEKTDTIRRPSSRLPAVGDTVRLTVGPRPPFAEAVIAGREEIRLRDVPVARRRELEALYGPGHPVLVRLVFRARHI